MFKVVGIFDSPTDGVARKGQLSMIPALGTKVADDEMISVTGAGVRIMLGKQMGLGRRACRGTLGRMLVVLGFAVLMVLPARMAAAYSIGGTAYAIHGNDFNVISQDYQPFYHVGGATTDSATAHIAFADAAVSVDMAAGTLKGSASAAAVGYGADAQAYFTDEIWLVDVPPEYADQRIIATISFRFQGTKAPGTGGHAGVSHTYVLGMKADGITWFDGAYSGPCTDTNACEVPTGYLDDVGAFDITLSREIVLYDPTIGIEIAEIGAWIQYAVNAGVPGTASFFDFSHTGTLDIVLPSGLSWTSASGVLLTSQQVTQVPEPASLLILAAGLAILAGMRRGVSAPAGLALTPVVG